jgi:hypothetical protein
LDADVHARDLTNLDQSTQSIGLSDLPISKSGTPFFPAPPPPVIPPQLNPDWTDIARLVAPLATDYFIHRQDPPPVTPNEAGKLPTRDDGLGAVLDAATFLLPQRRISGPLASVARVLEESALEAASRVAIPPQALLRTGAPIVARPYGKLSGTLQGGWQAHHLNQDAAFGSIISRNQGLSVPMYGNAFTGQGTSHFVGHAWMEKQFWDMFRKDGRFYLYNPTNAEYGEASRLSLIAGGWSPEQASNLAAQAAAQRAAAGLSETAAVPRIPRRIFQNR